MDGDLLRRKTIPSALKIGKSAGKIDVISEENIDIDE